MTPLPRHRDPFVTYQLERAHALGTLSVDAAVRLVGAAPRIGDVHVAATALADALEGEGRAADAVGAARLAEFFAPRPAEAQVGAAGHCQMGNLPLAIAEVSAWLQRAYARPAA